MSSFGILIPGRPVDTGFQQVDANKFLLTIPNAGSINHLVVFLTGIVQLPADAAGCIYFSLPDPSAPPTWHYLGFLTNEKPSAIYKLINLTRSKRHATAGELNNNHHSNQVQSTTFNGGGDGNGAMLNFNYVQAPVSHEAQIGIAIEPLSMVAQMVPAVETSASKADTFSEFINKTVSNLYNYCSSFSRPASELASNSFPSVSPFQTTMITPTTSRPTGGNTQYVPLATIQNWYETYTRRLGNDENFWKTLS